MKSRFGWILAIILGLVLLFVLPGLWLVGRPWLGGPGMMGGNGYMHLFGWGGMMLVWLIPVGIFVLLIVGGVALANSFYRSGNPPQPPATIGRTCSNCDKPAQVDWNTCPYCGHTLS